MGRLCVLTVPFPLDKDLNGDKVTYKYDNSDGLASVHDSAAGITTKYYYDFTDRLMKYTETGTDFNHSVAYTYDNLNNLTALKETINGNTLTTNYTYDDDNRITKVENTNNDTRTYSYDGFGRLTQRATNYSDTAVLTEDFHYEKTNVESHKFSFGLRSVTQYYEYDDNGNIIVFSEAAGLERGEEGFCTTYVYDSQNQLIRENNVDAQKTWVWTYDNAGNITSRSEYAYTFGGLGEPLDTVVYGYGDTSWGDLLTSYDGTAITYDTIGNPLNDGIWTYTWEHGRQLAAMSNGTTAWNYSYDANGMRTSRTNGTTTYTYVYNSGLLMQMTVGEHVLEFAYDASGTPMTVTLDGVTYYYLTNIQGDVVSIVDGNGTLVVHYSYDAWGNIIATSGTMANTLGSINPLRYRGYVYDAETGLYYLQSRYYNPTIGRFINADGHVATGQGLTGNNMFAYCGNNPTTRADHSGESFAIVLGFNFNLFGWGVTASINLVSTEENFGVQYSYYLSDDAEISKKQNSTIGVDIGPYIGIQYTDKTSMEELEGYAKATGGDGFLGLDVLTEENGNYLGWQFGASAFSHNMHSFYTNTETLFSIPTINLFDIFTGWIFGG